MTRQRHILWSLAAYVIFAAICSWAHGWQPPLNIDHLAYLRRADDLLTRFPDGGYWQGFEVRNTYAILMAFVHNWTGDHILSLKLLLAAMTVAWLAAFEWWFAALPVTRTQARLAALLGGLHFSFGAPQWGVASFNDSLHRTLAMPLLFLLLGWYWRQRQQGCRLLALPIAAALCLVHLGSAYLLAVLALVEAARAFREDDPRRASPRLLLALGSAAGVLALIQTSGLALAADTASQLSPHNLLASAASQQLSATDAWMVEFAALRWRNFPPTFATLLTFAVSAGPLVILGLLGHRAAQASPATDEPDRFMRRLAASALLIAFGWQASLALVRTWLPVYPLNFEELRTVVWVVPPLVYFTFRGFGSAAECAHPAGLRLAASLALVLTVVQPLQAAKLLPDRAKRALIEAAGTANTPNDRIRLRTARQWLGLPDGEPRFYYDARGVVAWLKAHTTIGQRVLTDRDECRLAPVEVVGAPTAFLGKNLRHPSALAWLQLNRELQEALAARDIPRLVELALANQADYIVLAGTVPAAVFTDEHYSIIAVSSSAAP